jgi:hypothetical protein
VTTACSNVTLAPQEFIELASAPAGYDGALLSTFIDAVSADPNFLEGCFRMFGPGSDGINNTGPMVYLSSGTEGVWVYTQEGRVDCDSCAERPTAQRLYFTSHLADYFLSASYFDMG